MEQKTISELKAKLESEKIRFSRLLERTHAHLHRTERLSADFAEQAVETENDEVVEVLDRDGHVELNQIKHALRRMIDGTYGQCTACGVDIQKARLLAIPETALCIECASKHE
jgi:RNA polymerase-binding protein DksA